MSEKEKKTEEGKKSAWLKYDEAKKKEVFDFCEGYKDFMSLCKTERECVDEIVRQAEELGYRDLMKTDKVKTGDKLYATCMGKAIALFVVGSEPLEKGMKLLGAHIDSPRLDIKQNPLYEDSELAMLETHYYGGIKKYQWVAIPLAVHGVVAKKDGTIIKINVGEKDDEPVLGISDLLIHLAADQMDKKASKVIEGEDLNAFCGSIPKEDEEKEAVKKAVLDLLKERYGFEEDDFMSAELELVPAGKARDYGFDRSMILAYGQDDRVCAYTSAKALFEIDTIDRTACCILVDKEEVGSIGATGMQSKFFENAVAELMDRRGEYSELKLRRALQNSQMLSSDVNASYDPNYPSVMEKKNAGFFGYGMVFSKFTGSRGKSGSNDANPEFIARLRAALDKYKIHYQMAELGKVDQGGGGTIAYIMANYGMEVIDSGVGLHSMHAPWEIASKADVFETKEGYVAFLKEI